MKNPAGFELIGCGVWGEVHARTYANSPHAKFIAVGDKDQNQAKHFAGLYKASNYYTDFKKILEKPEIDKLC